MNDILNDSEIDAVSGGSFEAECVGAFTFAGGVGGLLAGGLFGAAVMSGIGGVVGGLVCHELE